MNSTRPSSSVTPSRATGGCATSNRRTKIASTTVGCSAATTTSPMRSRDNEGFDRAVYDPQGPYEFGSKHVFGPNILEYGNSDRHLWLRNIVANQFVGKGLTAFIPTIERIAAEVLDRVADKGEIELVSAVSSQFPIRVISNMLGLPREDEDRFVEWYQALIGGSGVRRRAPAPGPGRS